MNLNSFLHAKTRHIKKHRDKMYQQYILMSRIFNKTQNEVDSFLYYGPYNAQSKVLFNPSKFFKTHNAPNLSVASCSHQILREKINKGDYVIDSECSVIEQYALHGFWSGTGTCETYAIIGAILLAQHYQVTVSIENIHSDLTHTYLRIHTTSREYIFDFWTRAMFVYGDWVEWNEVEGYDYRYSSSVSFSAIAAYINSNTLGPILSLLQTEENTSIRAQHNHLVRPYEKPTIAEEHLPCIK